MLRLMGKEKNGDWQKIDKLDENDGSEHPIESRKWYLMEEWQVALGRAWLFKWEKE